MTAEQAKDYGIIDDVVGRTQLDNLPSQDGSATVSAGANGASEDAAAATS
jgi:hypothetical protein